MSKLKLNMKLAPVGHAWRSCYCESTLALPTPPEQYEVRPLLFLLSSSPHHQRSPRRCAPDSASELVTRPGAPVVGSFGSVSAFPNDFLGVARQLYYFLLYTYNRTYSVS